MVLLLGFFMHACTLLVWHVLYLFLSPNINIDLILMQCHRLGLLKDVLLQISGLLIQVSSSPQFDWVT